MFLFESQIRRKPQKPVITKKTFGYTFWSWNYYLDHITRWAIFFGFFFEKYTFFGLQCPKWHLWILSEQGEKQQRTMDENVIPQCEKRTGVSKTVYDNLSENKYLSIERWTTEKIVFSRIRRFSPARNFWRVRKPTKPVANIKMWPRTQSPVRQCHNEYYASHSHSGVRCLESK